MSLLRKPAARGKEVGIVDLTGGAGLKELYPALAEFLTLARWDDGAEREPGTVMVLCEAGKWKAWLHDRAGRRSGWVSADGPIELLDCVEGSLLADSIGWRPDVKSGSQFRK